MKRVLSLIIIFGLSLPLFSQVKLSLLDGRQIKLESYVFHSEQSYIDYSFIKKNGKVKNSFADLEDIYSISINGKDSVIYAPLEEGEFEISQMQHIVYAKQFVQTEYNPWWAYVTGLVVGCGSMFIPMDDMTKMLIPIAFTAGMGFAKPSKSLIIKKYDFAQGDDWFIYGYKNGGRKKIFKNTVIGTVGGIFIAGVVVGTLSLINN